VIVESSLVRSCLPSGSETAAYRADSISHLCNRHVHRQAINYATEIIVVSVTKWLLNYERLTVIITVSFYEPLSVVTPDDPLDRVSSVRPPPI